MSGSWFDIHLERPKEIGAMNRLIRLMCGIAVALTMGLMIAPPSGDHVTLAQDQGQEDGLGTPPADIETPPDKIETSDPLPWGVLLIVGVLAIVIIVAIVRRSLGAQRGAAGGDRSNNVPPDNQRR
jgi:hypothetical protein